MLDPSLLKGRVGRDVRIVRVVAGDELAGAAEDAVARVGKPLPVVAGLRAVLGDGEAGELRAVRAEFRDPSD